MLALSKCHKGEDKRVLLPYLIHKDVLAPVFTKLVVDDGARDQHKEEHVEEDEDYVEDVIGLLVLDRRRLIVRVVIIRCQCVDLHYHQAEVVVVALIDVVAAWLVGKTRVDEGRVVVDHFRADERETHDYRCVVHDEDEDVLVR